MYKRKSQNSNQLERFDRNFRKQNIKIYNLVKYENFNPEQFFHSKFNLIFIIKNNNLREAPLREAP